MSIATESIHNDPFTDFHILATLGAIFWDKTTYFAVIIVFYALFDITSFFYISWKLFYNEFITRQIIGWVKI